MVARHGCSLCWVRSFLDLLFLFAKIFQPNREDWRFFLDFQLVRAGSDFMVSKEDRGGRLGQVEKVETARSISADD